MKSVVFSLKIAYNLFEIFELDSKIFTEYLDELLNKL